MRPRGALQHAFFIPTAASACLLTAPWLTEPAAAATPFVHETVDAAGDVGEWMSLVLDAGGDPRISYYDETNGDLKYARESGGVWRFEIVDAAGDVGRHTSLALDAQGDPRISYHDVTNGDLKYAVHDGGVWTLETVDDIGNVGLSVSLALDSEGNPHISYRDQTNTNLKYASKSGGAWTLETVDDTGNVGWDTSLALDSQGNPGISYYDVTNTDLKYASKSGGGWTLETVDGTGTNVGESTSLVLDAQDNPHISYHTASSANLKYASRSGGTWTPETVDNTGNLGRSTSLVLDAQGSPCISYRINTIGGGLKYAAKSEGVWTLETVDAIEVGQSTSMVLDAQGNPRICYHDETDGNLEYTDSAVHLLSPRGGERWAAGSQQIVRWSGSGNVSILLSDDGGQSYFTLLSSVSGNQVTINVPALTTEEARLRVSRSSPLSTSDSPGFIQIAPDLVGPWWSTTVDVGSDVGSGGTSLALDARGNPHISFSDGTDLDLEYARKSGGVWTFETVDATGNVGGNSSLALDAQDNPHISYRDITNDDLKYASKSGGAWTLEIVDTVAGETSLALDAHGNPHIAYHEHINGDLKYATKSGGTWTLETVVALGISGGWVSLALDAQGNPRISCYRANVQDLEYASKNGGVWTVETVDAAGSAGWYTSLALDAQGNPRISYYGSTDSEFKYASKNDGVWTLETVDTVEGGPHTSLVLGALGNPRICYYDNTNDDLKYASKSGGLWTLETVDSDGFVGQFASLALDTQGNPRIAHRDVTNLDLKYASAAIEISSPSPGDVWPVGASRTVTWDGTGRVDLSLSVDGGSSWQLQEPRLTLGEFRWQVPHTPSRFAKLKLERAVPYSVAVTDLFTIETSVSLLRFAVQLDPHGGAELTWSTDPGPADLAGYRIECARGGADWTTLVPLLRETRYTDAAGGAGHRYRLSAVNGLGQELVLGEAALLPARPLAAWPLPYRGGELNVSFAVFGRIGASGGKADVRLYDVAGRLVRVLAQGSFEGGQQAVTWDGRDEQGHRVDNGIYLMRVESGGERHHVKIAVVR